MPRMKAGAILLTSDPAAAYAGLLAQATTSFRRSRIRANRPYFWSARFWSARFWSARPRKNGQNLRQ